MSVSLTVNNTTYIFPSPGDEPGWGEEVTGWATEVTNVLSTLVGAGDILETSFTVTNNQSTAADVSGLAFSTATVRSAFIEYSIYRTSDTNTSGNAETGVILLVYDNSASTGNKWLISNGPYVGDAGVSFTVTDAGQVQYTSTDIGSTNYSGTMKFKARTTTQ